MTGRLDDRGRRRRALESGRQFGVGPRFKSGVVDIGRMRERMGVERLCMGGKWVSFFVNLLKGWRNAFRLSPS